MKVLVVHSGNKNTASPYITEQVDSLRKHGLDIEHFILQKSGLTGYLSHLPAYKKKIKSFKPDLIHAHFGLSGLFANLQRKVPVVTSFHGTDVHKKKNRPFSKAAYLLSAQRIFVSNDLKQKFNVQKGLIITCGIDTTLFKPISGINKENILLFGGRIAKPVKNYPLAGKAVDFYNNHLAEDNQKLSLIELKDKTREEVSYLMNQVKGLLITSHYEGSSQVLKEAMACNCPVVAVKVGSVPDLIDDNSSAGVIVDKDPKQVALGISKIMNNAYCDGRKILQSKHISLDDIAKQLIKLYKEVLIKKR